jgi:hypothetical protein
MKMVDKVECIDLYINCEELLITEPINIVNELSPDTDIQYTSPDTGTQCDTSPDIDTQYNPDTDTDPDTQYSPDTDTDTSPNNTLPTRKKLRKKKKSKYINDDIDNLIERRRISNLEASRRSRQKRIHIEKSNNERIKYLEDENLKLKHYIKTLEDEKNSII